MSGGWAVDDAARLAALAETGLIDTAPEQSFDDLATVASLLCAAPVALITLLDRDYQWFKARVGVDMDGTPVGIAICQHALAGPELLEICDLSADPRTRDNPLVTGDPRIRFYAGVPLVTASGQMLGTLCVIDMIARPDGLTEAQRTGLAALARQVMLLIEMRDRAADRQAILLANARRASEILERAERGEAARDLLRERDRRTRIAQEAGRIGTFEVDLLNDELTVSAEFCRLYGLPVQPSYPAATLEALILPDDRNARSTATSRRDGSAVLDVEYRIRRADDGELRWIARRAAYERDPHGEPIRMAGTVHDVTERHAAGERIVALLDLGDRLRSAESTGAIAGAAAEVAGRTLGAVRAGYASVEIAPGRFLIERDWTDGSVQSVAGSYDADTFARSIEQLKAGAPVAVGDLAVAGVGLSSATYANIGARAQLAVPLVIRGELIGALFVQDARPRAWSAAEIEFAQSVADRTYAALTAARAIEQQRLLNHELGHRLKNTLTLVQAIATQTLRNTDPQAVAAFEQRLMALAGAHDVLLAQRWTAAPVRVVASGAIAALGQEERVDASGPELTLGPRATLSLAMLLHELLTNALKYGALSVDGGRVALSWKVDGAGDAARVVVSWREQGGPPAAEPMSRGFGSRLIRAGLMGTGGTTARYLPTGLEVEFSASLKAALEE